MASRESTQPGSVGVSDAIHQSQRITAKDREMMDPRNLFRPHEITMIQRYVDDLEARMEQVDAEREPTESRARLAEERAKELTKGLVCSRALKVSWRRPDISVSLTQSRTSSDGVTKFRI